MLVYPAIIYSITSMFSKTHLKEVHKTMSISKILLLFVFLFSNIRLVVLLYRARTFERFPLPLSFYTMWTAARP